MPEPQRMLYVVGEDVARHLDAVLDYDTAEGNHSNLRRTTSYVHDHVPFRSLNVKTDTKCGGHRFVYHVDVASAGVFRRVAHGANFNFGTSRGDTNDDAQ